MTTVTINLWGRGHNQVHLGSLYLLVHNMYIYVSQYYVLVETVSSAFGHNKGCRLTHNYFAL